MAYWRNAADQRMMDYGHSDTCDTEGGLVGTGDIGPALEPIRDLFGPTEKSTFPPLQNRIWDQASSELMTPITSCSLPYSPMASEYAKHQSCFAVHDENQHYINSPTQSETLTAYPVFVQQQLSHQPLWEFEQQWSLEHIAPNVHCSCSPVFSSLAQLPQGRERSSSIGIKHIDGGLNDDETSDLASSQTDGVVSTEVESDAQLIYRALTSVLGHSMVVGEIYEWIEKNANKDPTPATAWRSSVRHNLSVNGVCENNLRFTFDRSIEHMAGFCQARPGSFFWEPQARTPLGPPFVRFQSGCSTNSAIS